MFLIISVAVLCYSITGLKSSIIVTRKTHIYTDQNDMQSSKYTLNNSELVRMSLFQID